MSNRAPVWASTAELAQRHWVRENTRFRPRPDKKAMSIAFIDSVYEQAARTWKALLIETYDTVGAYFSLRIPQVLRLFGRHVSWRFDA